jgi:hypothetical protein
LLCHQRGLAACRKSFKQGVDEVLIIIPRAKMHHGN